MTTKTIDESGREITNTNAEGTGANPLSKLRGDLSKVGQSQNPIIGIRTALSKQIAEARVARYAANKIADGMELIIDQQVEGYVADVRKRFFLDRAGQNADLHAAIMNISARAKETLTALITDKRRGIMQSEKTRVEALEKDVADGLIYSFREERERERIFEETELLIEKIASEASILMEEIERDLRLTVQRFSEN